MKPVNKTTYIIAAAALLIFAAVLYFLFIFQKGEKVKKGEEVTDEIKQIDEIPQEKRPYITLTPTTDGAEIILSMENMAAFDNIEYTLTYLADNPEVPGEKIERGSTGFDVNTKDQKYKKSILLGTASKGTRSPDKGVTDGVLTLNLTIGDSEYTSQSDWDLVETGTRPISLEDKSGNFTLEVPAFTKSYWVIVSDTLGIPPNPPFETSTALVPPIGTFSVAPEFKSKADLSIKVEKEGAGLQLYSYKTTEGTWEKLDAAYNSTTSTLTAKVASFATFVVASQE